VGEVDVESDKIKHHMKTNLLRLSTGGAFKQAFICLLLSIFSLANVHAQTDIARWTYEPLQGATATPTPNTGTGSSSIVGSMSGPGTGTGMNGTGCGSQVTGQTAI
jgi:hypothetical protein